jgi:hypothetical protein
MMSSTYRVQICKRFLEAVNQVAEQTGWPVSKWVAGEHLFNPANRANFEQTTSNLVNACVERDWLVLSDGQDLRVTEAGQRLAGKGRPGLQALLEPS